jgi:hypothetical protein
VSRLIGLKGTNDLDLIDSHAAPIPLVEDIVLPVEYMFDPTQKETFNPIQMTRTEYAT